MQEIIVVLAILSSLAFAIYKMVQRFRSRIRRRKQRWAKRGRDLSPMFTYPKGTMILGPSNHFYGHEGSRVIFVSSKWKELPREKWPFDKIWDEDEDLVVRKVRKDGRFALVDEEWNVISDFYSEVKINFKEIKVRRRKEWFLLTISLVDNKITLNERLLEWIILASFLISERINVLLVDLRKKIYIKYIMQNSLSRVLEVKNFHWSRLGKLDAELLATLKHTMPRTWGLFYEKDNQYILIIDEDKKIIPITNTQYYMDDKLWWDSFNYYKKVYREHARKLFGHWKFSSVEIQEDGAIYVLSPGMRKKLLNKDFTVQIPEMIFDITK
jgi:hypothetical protein